MEGQAVRVMHVVRFHGTGGVECTVAGFLHGTADRRLEHHVLVAARPLHPYFRALVRERAASVHHARFLAGVRVPRWPPFLRRAHLERIVRRVSPHLLLLYCRLGDLRFVQAAGHSRCGAVCVHYEHGTAWGTQEGACVTDFLASLKGVIAVSRAAGRVLELRYGCPPAMIRLCYNGVRLPAPPEGAVPKELPVSRPLRLAYAGRLDRRKAPVVAVHVLAKLLQRGGDFELHVAGAGTELASMRAAAARLGVAQRVVFHGFVEDMPAFYQDVDVLLCLSIQETLANVCVEAGYFGCPVVGARVDGIPEVVVDGETGFCVRPELPLESYEALGGSPLGDGHVVYDPDADCLAQARLVSPDAVADAVLRIVANGPAFRQMSARAHEVTARRFDFQAYAAHLNELLLEFAGWPG